jgi:hypothetical protein
VTAPIRTNPNQLSAMPTASEVIHAIRELELRIRTIQRGGVGGAVDGTLGVDGGSAGTTFTVDDVLDGGTA